MSYLGCKIPYHKTCIMITTLLVKLTEAISRHPEMSDYRNDTKLCKIHRNHYYPHTRKSVSISLRHYLEPFSYSTSHETKAVFHSFFSTVHGIDNS